MGALYPSLSDLIICISPWTVRFEMPLSMPSNSYSASDTASMRSSSVHFRNLFWRHLSSVLYRINAFLFAGIFFNYSIIKHFAIQVFLICLIHQISVVCVPLIEERLLYI